ncbi:MAG: tetratricopeptide repeat protein [Mariprofundaceae bacterium]
MKDKTPNSEQGDIDTSHGEMHELKRDMQSAKVEAWLHENQKSLIAGVVGVFLVIAGSAFWQERSDAQQASASALYQQALITDQDETKKQLLDEVVAGYRGSSYAVLALVQLGALDGEGADTYLQQLIDHKGASMEFRWQARLDLAERHLLRGEREQVKGLLKERTGIQYEQYRYYLLAEANDVSADKKNYYRKALDAASHDGTLKQRIEQQLALIESGS